MRLCYIPSMSVGGGLVIIIYSTPFTDLAVCQVVVGCRWRNIGSQSNIDT